jgi:AcrR family transcriptional regulator
MMTAYSPIEMPADAFPRTTTVRDDATRDALLKAADRLLVTEGPSALTVRAIANEADMSTMNVYSRFGSKEGIIDELFRRGFASLNASMESVPETDNPLHDLYDIGVIYRDFATTNEAYYSLMFDRPVRGFEPTPESLGLAASGLKKLGRRVQRCLDAGVFVGTDADQIAASIWATCHGLVCIERFRAYSSIDDWDSLFEATMTMIARGLSPAHVPTQ